MDKPVFLDTSAWIAVFRKDSPPSIKEEIGRLLSEKRIVVTHLIILELLSGARSQKEFDELYEDFSVLERAAITEDVWENAYKISFNLRRRGHTIPFIDIIIASICLKNEYSLLHKDKHYEAIKHYYPLHAKHLK